MEIFSILKSTFKDFYEHLFKLVLLSTAWFIITAFLLFLIFIALNISWYLLILLPLFFIGPIYLSALYGAERILNTGQIKLKKLIKFLKENFWRSFISFLATVILYLIFIVDLRFFLLKGQDNIWLLAFAFLFAYLLIYFTIYQAYLWPLLVLQKEKDLKIIFRNAVVLSLDNIIFSLGLFLAIFVLTSLLFVTGIGIPAAFIGIIGLLIIKGTEKMLAKY